jgi:hypothetical protein
MFSKSINDYLRRDRIYKYYYPNYTMADLISDKNEISKIISDKIRGKKVIFTKYCDMSLAEKGIPMNESWKSLINLTK